MLFFVFFLGYLTSTAAKSPVIELPSVSFVDLFHVDGKVGQYAAEVLTTLGALQITDIPGFSEARYEALHGLSSCMLNDIETSSVITLKDGSRRVSFGAATVEGKPQRMPSDCGYNSFMLRSTVHNAVRQLFQVLDAVVDNKGVGSSQSKQRVMSPYITYTDLVEHGSHLENMHTYSFGKTADKNASALGFHTDGGLFIGMTTGMYSASGDICDESGLFIEDRYGVASQVKVDDSSLIVMVGEGGSTFLSPLLGKPLRAVPHKLKLCVKTASALDSITRSWYGKMFLPPDDALVNPAYGRQSMRYDNFRASEIQSILNNSGEVTELPTVCGSLKIRHMGMTSSDSSCADNEVLCWLTCTPVGDLPCGMDAKCVDTVTNQVVDGSQMCPENDMSVCELQCIYNDTDPGYCYGSGTVMFMDGFRTFTSNGVSNCLNLWFDGWTLNDNIKVAIGCLGVLLFGIASQFIAALRKSEYSKGSLKSTALFLVHITCSYFLMLAAMTYSAEIFCMVCIGLSMGHFAFHTDNYFLPKSLRVDSKRSFSTGGDPCCASSVIDDVGLNLKKPLI